MAPKYWFCLIGFLSQIGSSQAQPDSGTKFSTSQLVVDLRGTPDTPKADQAPTILYKQRHAEGYLAGVMDATEGGNAWCRPTSIKPGELEEIVWTALDGNTAKGASSAAKDVIEVLRTRFPCPRRK